MEPKIQKEINSRRKFAGIFGSTSIGLLILGWKPAKEIIRKLNLKSFQKINVQVHPDAVKRNDRSIANG